MYGAPNYRDKAIPAKRKVGPVSLSTLTIALAQNIIDANQGIRRILNPAMNRPDNAYANYQR
jgi:hypothetical protein